jgi:PAS domain S-box-containing protein
MMTAPLPGDEAARLAALRRYDILDTPAEREFDELAAMAAHICGAPMALVSLVDADRQWFKARIGLEAAETPRAIAFCAHAILKPEVMVIPDALADARFATNPLVTAQPRIRFYAAAPLVSPDGHALGTLCVLDRVPRDLRREQAQALQALSRQAVGQLELRRSRAALSRATLAAEAEEDQFRSLFEHSIDAILLATPEGKLLAANPEACRMFGRSEAELCAIGRPAILDPDDPKLHALLAERERAGAFRGELLFKRKDGSRFPGEISSAFYQDRSGQKLASVTIRDVSERKRAERRTAAEHAVTRVLAECATLAEAAPRVLRALCENLGWSTGALWRVDRQARLLRCEEIVHLEPSTAGELERASRGRTLASGVGLAGRVWSSGQPVWMAEIPALALPIRLGADVLGVMEFFSREPHAPEEASLRMMAAVGSQIGQFIERERSDELIRTTAAAVASATGAEFFRALVQHLAAVLETRHAFITECTDDARTRVRMLALWKNGTLEENLEYDVADTPCEAVLTGEVCWHSHDLQQRFPKDLFLARMRAESFLGIPLTSSSGQVLGHLVVLDDKPMPNDPRGLPVLRIFAARAAAELARVRSERRLRETNQFLQEIIDGAAEGIIVYDTELRYVVFNRFMERLHGVRAEDVLGKRAPEVFPFVRESGIDTMVKRALQGEAVVAPDLLLRKPGRLDVWELYRVSPYRDASGRIVGAIGLVSDITQRKQAEDALRHAHSEIAELNKRLEAENVYLRRDLIANVSHDLRTPLAALHGYLETLLVKGQSLSPEQQKIYLETAVRQSEHLGTLIAELFELVKLDFKGFEIQPETVQLGELAQDVLQKFRLLAEEKRIALKAEIGPGLPSVQADIGLMERVLENLIDNALRHTPAGGMVSVAVVPHGGRVRVRVADTGSGIPPAEIPHIFERFYRVDKSRTSRTGGAGLGLAIVKRIMDLHAARVEVESTPLEGAAFSFALPPVAL